MRTVTNGEANATDVYEGEELGACRSDHVVDIALEISPAGTARIDGRSHSGGQAQGIDPLGRHGLTRAPPSLAVVHQTAASSDSLAW